MKRARQHLAAATFVAVLALGSPASVANGQHPAPTLAEMRLATFVDEASARASDYFKFFRDLTAEETKTVEQFRENGEVSKRRLIVSDLIVYKSLLDNGSISEYRDVKSVDGAPIAGREQRVQALFARQSHAKSVTEELRRINQEGSRYDLDYTISGLTMSQGLPLQPWARALFTFREAGSETIDGREALILAYQQVAPNSRFGFNLSLPGELRAAEPLFRGWVWLDPKSARLIREVREVTVLPAGSATPVVVQRFEFQYAPSRFDLLLPRRIVFSSLGHYARGSSGFTSAVKYRLSFEYGEFRRFTATSDDLQLADVGSAGEAASVAPATPGSIGNATASAPDSDLGPEFGPDAPLGPPPTQQPTEPATRRVEPAVARAATVRSNRPVPATASPRLTLNAGLPASAALAIPVTPLPVSGPSAAGPPAVPVPPPPLAPGEKPRFRPPPS